MEHRSDARPDVLADRGATGTTGRNRAGGLTLRGIVALVLCALMLQATSGCFFGPRDPDGPPDQGTEIPWETPSTTDAVLRNMAAALAGEGVSNYMDCFASDNEGGFRFHVDPQDSLAAGDEGDERYDQWFRDDEATYIEGVFLESDKGMSLTFTSVEDPDENADDTYRKDDYVLNITWRSGDHQPGEQETFRGRVTLYLKRDETQLWSVYKWVDRRAVNPNGASTWGVLRGDYRD
jgi:hypothetical protein